jgi:hypothetical protein
MRIDAIYLVAPEPEPEPKPDPKHQPPSMPTRRAFLMTAGALVLGAGGGGACGYSMGVAAEAARAADAAAKPAAGEPGKSSGDAELDYWRGVAQGPLDELFEKALTFVVTRVRDYPEDSILWQGVERMVIELRDNPARQVEDAVLLNLTSQIEGRARPAEPALREFVPVLRQRRQELRRKR